MSEPWQSLLPILVHVQANLDGDLSLDALSRLAGQSPGHFHRRFRAAVGETAKQYVTRLRLERAAFLMAVQDASLLDIALECGFCTHETFLRAFHRRFGKRPSQYRAASGLRDQQNERVARNSDNCPFALSKLRVRRLQPCHLAFVRHLGPYQEVPASLFDRLEDWAETHDLRPPRVWIGIGHDAPSTAPADRLRFDAALIVPQPFASRGGVGYQRFDGGEHATVTHIGPFSTLEAAYASILSQVRSLPRYRLIGLPAVELYHAARLSSGLQVNTTDLCLPVERI